MFWMMIYLLVFGGGLAMDPDLLPDSDALRKAVTDPGRQQRVLADELELARVREALHGDLAQAYAALRELNGDRDSAAADWDAVFARMERDWARADEATLDALYRMRAAMTPEEWRRVFSPPLYRRLLPQRPEARRRRVGQAAAEPGDADTRAGSNTMPLPMVGLPPPAADAGGDR